MNKYAEKKLILSNDIFLNLFFFNEKKYLKIFTEKTFSYFISNNITFNLKYSLNKKSKILSLNSSISEQDLFNYLIFYISQIQKISRKKLLVKGLGYKITILENKDLENTKTLQLKLGYSHLKSSLIPKEISNFYLTKNSITFESFNSSWLGNFITKLKLFKKPDIYKGKGLHIKNQKVLILKPIKKK
jgi:hypothetical protein